MTLQGMSAMNSSASPAVSPSAASLDPVLEIRGLCVDYGFGDDAVHAVSDCDLTLGRGRVLGLAGESGSGKSTLAMAAIRLLRRRRVITGGEVLFHSKAGVRERARADRRPAGGKRGAAANASVGPRSQSSCRAP